MSQASTYLAAAAALGAASEATGTTAFTPLGQQAREQQGGGGDGPPSFPSVPSGGVSEDVLAQLAESFQQQQAGTSVDLSLGGLGQQAGGGAGTALALEELRRRLEEQQQQARQWQEEARTRWENRDVDGDGESDAGDGLTLPDWLKDPPGQGGDGGDGGGGSDPDDFRLQDLDGRGPFGIGTWLAAGGEIGAAAGDTGGKGVDFATDVGNTYLQGYKALRGQEYSAEDTLAEDIHGTGTRRVNWDDHLPSLPDVDLPGGGSSRTSSSKKDTPKVIGLNAGTEALWFNKNNGDDSSSKNSTTTSSKPDPKPLTEELRERLEGSTNQPGGGLQA